MAPKAAIAIKKASETIPLADLGAFIKRAVYALAVRGIFRGPVDDAALSMLDEPAPPPMAEPMMIGADGYDAASPDELAAQDQLAQQFAAPTADVPVDAQAGPTPIVGDQINRNWHSFASESGTLGLPRDQMPQISAEHRGALVQFLKGKGVAHQADEVAADSLKPTQAEFSPQKVRRAVNFKGGDRSILVSHDGHVLDGTHQWLAKMHSGDPVKVIRLGAPIEDLLRLAHQFPSSTVAKGSSRPTAGSAAQLSKVPNENAQVLGTQEGNQADGSQGVAQGQGDGSPNGAGQNAVQNAGPESIGNAGGQNAIDDQGQYRQDDQVNGQAGVGQGGGGGEVLPVQQPDEATGADDHQRQGDQLPGVKPAFDYRMNADGTVAVIGDSGEIKAALPGMRGLTGRDGVTYGRSDAAAVVEALYAMAAADAPQDMQQDMQPAEEGQVHEEAEPANVENDESAAAGTEAPAAPDQASEADAGDAAAAADVPDERPAADIQAAGVAPDDAAPQEASAGTPADPARIAALRAREAVLKTIAESLT